ncbi:MAG: carboxypeptidase regulatory-like domain-containing protein [Planctomycetes bacterium]|nr:carboxypeptidase regulatory-like domain-containing protein [Planctomycetota bacterium]
MRLRLASSCALVALSVPWMAVASAQTLKRVGIESSDPRALAERFTEEGYDVLEGSVKSDSLELVVSDASLAMLELAGFAPRVLEIGRPYKDIQAEQAAAAGSGDAVPSGYPNGAQILTSMSNSANAFPAICQFVDLTATLGMPATVNGNHLYACKISDNVATDEDEPTMLVLCGSHCRELAVHVIGLDTITKLTTLYGVNSQVTAAVDNYEIWVIPNANPDGYDWVFNVDNLWRKNRRVFAGGIGVDLNRNYNFGWSSPCSGSTFVPDETYKGPSPASEAEVQTVKALQNRERFAKVLDYHSYGSETLWGYLCWGHPWGGMLQLEAIQISLATGYGGAERAPSAHGEQWHDPLAFHGAIGFLTEVGSQFQPTYASALANEVPDAWGGTLYFANRPITLSGHVTDSVTGAPIVAAITYPTATFTNGETNASHAGFGRYHSWLPAGTTQVKFSAPGYASQQFGITATSTSSQVLAVQLVKDTTATFYCTAKTNSLGCVPVMDADGNPSASAGSGFVLSAASVLNKKAGLLFYSTVGANGNPFQGGTLCCKLPIVRTPVQNSGGSASGNDCTGTFVFDFNGYIAAGADPNLVSGANVWSQYWSRDPGFAAPNNTSLSNGTSFTILP